MKTAVLNAILTEVTQPYPSIGAVSIADYTPREFCEVYWTGYPTLLGTVDWEQNRYFLLLVLAAEEVEVDWEPVAEEVAL